MTKKEVLARVCEITSYDSKTVSEVLSAYQTTIVSLLRKEKEAVLLDFGKMKVVHRNSRNGINPQTGKTIVVPAKDTPKITFSKKLKNFVEGVAGVKESDFKY